MDGMIGPNGRCDTRLPPENGSNVPSPAVHRTMVNGGLILGAASREIQRGVG